MKTFLHTPDGNQYSEDYMSVFSSARVELLEEIQREVGWVREWMEDNYHPTLKLLVMIANNITAYNEMSTIIFFYKTKDF